MEEQLCPGLGLLLCAEVKKITLSMRFHGHECYNDWFIKRTIFLNNQVDHVKTDYKFGLGVKYEGL